MKLECFVARKDQAAARANFLGCEVEDRGTGLQRLQERRLLTHGGAVDPVLLPSQLGIGRAHHVNGARRQLVYHWFLRSQQPHHADSSAKNATQDVTAALVGWRYA